MKKMFLRLAAVVAGVMLCGALLPGRPASSLGSANRTWVSGVGNDSNLCSRAAPCQTFAGAIFKTAQSGEIDVLDPGNFGAVNIAQSITIDGGGGQVASTVASGVNGIVVNGAPADVIILRNIRLTGAGTGLDGVKFNSGATLRLENVAIEGFTRGVHVTPSGAAGQTFVDGTSIRNNATGIAVDGASSVLRLSNSVVESNGTGLATTNGGMIVALGANTISGNGAGNSPTAVSTEGSDVGAINAVNDHTDSAVSGVAGTVNSNTNSALATTNAKVDQVSTKLGPAGVGPAGTGFNTNAFCAEGSVRKDSAGVLQMYVTLFSRTPQSVTINYITNKGTKSKTVPLAAGVRYTDDVNAFLTGPIGQFPGAPDVDTSVEVIGTAPVFLACPVYFSRSIGEAGPVSGGTVQDGSHN